MIRARARYRFDNMMARGVTAQVLLLASATVVLVLIATVATVLLGVQPVDDDGRAESFGSVVWVSLMHSLDAGMVGGDALTSWTYLAVMLVVTIGGLFVVAALIGVLNQGFGDILEGLRRGRSAVVERNHTVVLGWNSKLFALLTELAEANANRRGACVVILADRDKVAMDEEIAAALEGTRLRVVTRRGDALTIDDLHLVSPATARAVVVLAPEHRPDGAPATPSEADAVVMKSLLALRKVLGDKHVHVVAELLDERTVPVARMVTGPAAALVTTGPLISRLLVQTGRQSGLAEVYGELLDFAGVEIYVTPVPKLAGTTFRDAVFRFGSSTLIGVLTADDTLMLPPPWERVFEAGDRVVAISEDDDTVVLDGAPGPASEARTAIVPPGPGREPHPERVLVLGSSPRLPLVLRELDGFLPPGSAVLVVGEEPEPQPLDHATLEVRDGDLSDRGVLDALDVPSFDHVLLLSESRGRSQDMADARTMVSLLHLRDITKETPVPITSEILDVRSRDLASGGDRDDFIVSSRLISLVISQIAENPYLAAVLDDLLSRDGHELYLRPVTDYVEPGEWTFGTVCEAALRRGELAIGYRRAGGDRATVVNPAKSATVRFAKDDQVVVLAEQ
ncbi:potassium transporter TrkA [Spongisporangium articulatum]|uniref:Potassium transporter TrkA n=1 Tax=Spongisporangium articulatum TaxID=3362603 RepID=A0ABW8AM75_9ACTN